MPGSHPGTSWASQAGPGSLKASGVVWLQAPQPNLASGHRAGAARTARGWQSGWDLGLGACLAAEKQTHHLYLIVCLLGVAGGRFGVGLSHP